MRAVIVGLTATDCSCFGDFCQLEHSESHSRHFGIWIFQHATNLQRTACECISEFLGLLGENSAAALSGVTVYNYCACVDFCFCQQKEKDGTACSLGTELFPRRKIIQTRTYSSEHIFDKGRRCVFVYKNSRCGCTAGKRRKNRETSLL